MTFEDKAFDVVVAQYVVTAVPNPAQAMAALANSEVRSGLAEHGPFADVYLGKASFAANATNTPPASLSIMRTTSGRRINRPTGTVAAMSTANQMSVRTTRTAGSPNRRKG